MNDKQNNNKTNTQAGPSRNVSRGAAIRAQQRSQGDAQRVLDQYDLAPSTPTVRANQIDDSPRLKVIALGGMDAGGSKNMIILEYMNDAIVIDCGNELGVDLPGINYAICDISYLESIKHKLRAYVISHGHLDHIGGLPHIVPKVPAPIYGSKFTIGMIDKHFENFSQSMPDGFELKTVVMNEETHEKLKIGSFFVELVRITHSIPGSTCVIVDTPVGKIVCTGDYRLDPNPLDHERSDTERLKQIGSEGVLALLNECLCAERLGRTPSESTIEPTFVDLFANAPGRVFVAVFSSNINRIQMLVNAAVAHGRKIAMDGRSMMGTLEVAVKLGMIKIPKGTFVPIASVSKMNDQEVVVVCTGSQGEPNSALQRMSIGDHKYIKLKSQDTVILSSTPIPDSGNDRLITKMVDELNRNGVFVKRHTTHEADSCGPLHVSGHCSLDEYMDMIDMIKPKFLIPIYGTYTAQKYHNEAAIERGFPRANTSYINNGQVIALTKDKMEVIGEVPVGTVLVDQTGATVSSVVIKDRLMLAEEGLVAVVLTIDKKRGETLTSPDIISRGFIYMRDNEEMMKELRNELRRAVSQRFRRVDLDRFKQEIREHVTHFLFDHTQRSPIVIPVVNIIGGGRPDGKSGNPTKPQQTEQEIAADQQKRFQEMRLRLLSQDARTD
ncbi:MAG TPA: ribonuclease J [Candidatus Saccharimonadales bacterium]|nr:ribonuclease J [Candidatus Saccharimonadales bacterium]